MEDTFNLVHRFDRATKKHYINNWNTVLHCHHYASTFTELAISARSFAGIENLIGSAEHVFGTWLKDYYRQKAVNTVAERVWTAEQYWKTIGMGLVKIVASSPDRGMASMDYSHIDAGWLQRMGHWNSPVNFITQGFLAGVFSAVFDKPLGSYSVEETQSLVMGDNESRFDITLKEG